MYAFIAVLSSYLCPWLTLTLHLMCIKSPMLTAVALSLVKSYAGTGDYGQAICKLEEAHSLAEKE